jgi:hypothetical protein
MMAPEASRLSLPWLVGSVQRPPGPLVSDAATHLGPLLARQARDAKSTMCRCGRFLWSSGAGTGRFERRQVQFLFNVRRLLSDGSFVATYKVALPLGVQVDRLACGAADVNPDLVAAGAVAARGVARPPRRPAGWPRAAAAVAGGTASA